MLKHLAHIARVCYPKPTHLRMLVVNVDVNNLLAISMAVHVMYTTPSRSAVFIYVVSCYWAPIRSSCQKPP